MHEHRICAQAHGTATFERRGLLINPNGLVPTLLASMGGTRPRGRHYDGIVLDYHEHLSGEADPERS